MDLKKRIFWQVSLSNGETFYDGKGIFVHIEGGLSTWNRLIKYTVENKVLITSLSLFTYDKGEKHPRTFNLPSAGRDPKFAPFALAEKPIDFRYGHFLAQEHDVVKNVVVKSVATDWFAYIEAIYPTYKLQLWVDENNTRNSWVLLVKN